MSGERILVMAGGTGGHVFPALAVARELRERGAEVRWLGTRKGMEAELVPSAGFPIDYISVEGLRGRGAAGWLMAPVRVTRAVVQARRIVAARDPDVVLGLGGFATGPGGVAARLAGRPLIIHEQNAIPGLTNRLLARIATRVLSAFPGAFDGGAEVTGNPVRPEIAALPAPALRYEGRRGPLRLLVVGGSLGATALNAVVPRALAAIPEEIRPRVVHQTGRRNLDEARRHYAEAGVEAEVVAFIDDMAAAYGEADLAICRSGALTVSELAAAGVPSLLVPYPHAVDDHQTANARFLTDAGAALLVQQSHLTPAGLAALIEGFCTDAGAGRRRLLTMAEAARTLARTDATKQVANTCLAEAGGRVG